MLKVIVALHFLLGSLGPGDDECCTIENSCYQNASKRNAEEVSLRKEDVA